MTNLIFNLKKLFSRRILSKLRKLFSLISEGRTFWDKIKIFFWFLGIEKDLYLNNKDGIFFVRKNSSDLWILSPWGEKELRDFFNLDEGVFIDIGANVGKYSIMIGKQLGINGKVYAIEPEPENIFCLKKNIKLNKLKNIKIIEEACSDLKKNIDLYINSKNTGGHSIINKSTKKITVKSNTLDNMLQKNKISRVDLIKIDVEGAEVNVLKGAKYILKKHHPKLIFEAWSEGHFKKVKDILDKYNYTYTKVGCGDYFAE